MKNKILLPLLLALSPLVASAQLGGVKGLIVSVGDIVVTLTKIAAAAALLVFFWGLVKFISKAGDVKAVEEGRRFMLWGIIALFVMVSVWGIVLFLQTQLNIHQGLPFNVPTFPNP
jgi:hypothetical protein